MILCTFGIRKCSTCLVPTVALAVGTCPVDADHTLDRQSSMVTNDLGSSGERFLMVSASVFYLGSIILTPFIYATWFPIPREVTYSDLPHAVFQHQVAGLIIILPSVILLISALLFGSTGSLRQAFPKDSLGPVLWTAVTVCTSGMMLDFIGLWPFTWRSQGNGTPLHVASLLGGANWLGLILLSVRLVIITPLIEEIIFRLQVLRGFSRLTRSNHTGILISAGLFAILHVGRDGDTVTTLNAFCLFVFSILLGYVTVARRGTLWFALAAHASRNLVELFALCVFVLRKV
jgi:hypothetical protein